jgi:6-phosphogluconolactonase
MWSGPRHLAFRPDGKFAYVINEIACTVTAFAFDATRGVLTEIQTLSTLPPGEILRPNFVTAEVCVHPSGQFLYGSTRGHNSIAAFQIDGPTGKLTPVQHVSSGGLIPRNFNLDPAGRFLLSANQNSGNVVVFSIDGRTGRLTPTGQKVELEKPVCIVFVPTQ